ncbi:MAG TPA: DUF5317 domain-containing protein [Mycobacteriales bacterium]|nr:DUF5317 domain-containing protein [Mycobacteriales bacterium]
MALVGIVVVGAIIVAACSGGRLSGFAHEELRAPGYVVLAVIAQVVGAVLADHTSTGWIYPTGLAVSAACALVFCIANFRVAGVPLVAIGLVLNAVVVARNGAMPVSIAAASRAGVSTLTVATDNDPRHTIAGRGSVWRGLGDVIPVPLPVSPEVVSPGDVLVAAGLGEFIVVTSRRRRSQLPGEPTTDVQWPDFSQAAHELSTISARS